MSRRLLANMHIAIMGALREYIASVLNGDKPEEVHDCLGYYSGLIRAAYEMELLSKARYEYWENVRGMSAPSRINLNSRSDKLWKDLGDNVY